MKGIKFSNYEALAKEYQKGLSDYSEWIKIYLQYLDDICKTAIISGNLHDEIFKFREELARIKDIPESVSSRFAKIIYEFLDDLDEAQKINGVSILYDRKYNGYRDYSQEFFLKLKDCSENADYDCGGFNIAYDFMEDLWLGLWKLIGSYDNSKKEDLKKTQKRLLQLNDVTRRQVTNIERRLLAADEKCGEHIKIVAECIKATNDYILVFREILVNFQNSPESMSLANYDFASKYAVMINSYNNVLIIDKTTNEDVEKFINSEASEEYMDEQVGVVHNYLADLSSLEMSDVNYWKIIAFQMFDIAEGTITSGDYKKLMMKKELTDMMADLAKNYVYSDSDEQKALNEIQSLIKDAQDAGQSIYDFFNTHRDSDGKLFIDGRTKYGKNLSKFLDNFDNGMDILKYGSQGIELFTKLFIDYNKNLCFLDSFERNAVLSDDMTVCLAELRATYEHELGQTASDAVKLGVGAGVDVLYSLSIGKMVGKVKTVVGIIGSITGETAKTGAKVDLLNYGYNVVESSQTAFLESLKKLKAAEKGTEQYQALTDDFKNCFSIYKGSLKRLFEKMAIASDGGAQKDYFYYCSTEVSSASIKDFSSMKIMSYEEYLKDGYAF